ncbi:MAG TPA: hypothetical protein PKA28_10560 [Methylomusa anaerophila]|uniref:Uncharacterized protein n=1 Tax=Methylomusa anaerophila TaxID=1930071 RepID=A0A348AIV7_9FIRM|nr:hypothetical protein [Methylomusa anaerophila]BBB91005.1 hypothetical protein MAMMFC1_01672 [Methylomusa anaerophila]HML88876.1 hypothetical protein [Methylomusa anaerophila]
MCYNSDTAEKPAMIHEGDEGDYNGQGRDLLAAVNKLRQVMSQSLESVDSMRAILTEGKSRTELSAAEWADMIDNMQQILYLESAIAKLRNGFNAWGAAYSPRNSRGYTCKG